jgi:hypothetical protein
MSIPSTFSQAVPRAPARGEGKLQSKTEAEASGQCTATTGGGMISQGTQSNSDSKADQGAQSKGSGGWQPR